MYTGLLHLHNLLRWIILLLLVINIIKTFSGNKSLGASKGLLISAHVTLLLGLYQYFFGNMGFKLFSAYGAEVMKTASLRFWAVEHITGMIVAIILITVGHVSLKKSGNTKKTAILYTIALLLIIAVIPWPFREGIGRALFPGM
jgi:Flp pilus assembly protein protease CpaA